MYVGQLVQRGKNVKLMKHSCGDCSLPTIELYFNSQTIFVLSAPHHNNIQYHTHTHTHSKGNTYTGYIDVCER